ncbi:MAG: ATP-binding protein [Candidatus Firestonebacteria bacterium]
MVKPRILIIDDEEMITELVKEILSDTYDIESSNSSVQGVEKIKEGFYNIVLSDLRMPGLDGIGVLQKVKEYSPKTDVIIMTGFATIDSAVETIKFGAFDYITKPFEIDHLRQKIENSLEKQKLNAEVGNLKDIVSIYEVSKALSSSMGLTQMLQLILDIGCKLLNGDSGSIMLMDDNTQELVIGAHVGLKEALVKNLRVKLGDNIAGWVAEKQETVLLLNGLENDKRFSDQEPRKEIKSSMVTVLKNDDKVIGVISINSLKSVNFFDQRALKIFSIFANNAAFAIKEAKIYDRLKELDRLKSEFVSSVSHELKTPLTSISASIEMIVGGYAGDISPDVKHFMNIIKNNADRLVRLVNNVLDFSRVDAGVMLVTKTPIGITGLVKAVVEELTPLARQKGLTIVAEVVPNEVILKGDANRIKQVLVNLVGNALKFCSTGRIFVGVSEAETEIKIWVKDEGPGIPEDKQLRIFEKFFRVDNSLRRDTAGFGIGLTLSKSIVEAHGGRIWFESVTGKGTTFYFTLPKGNNNDERRQQCLKF